MIQVQRHGLPLSGKRYRVKGTGQDKQLTGQRVCIGKFVVMKKLLTLCALGCLLSSAQTAAHAAAHAMAPAIQPPLAWFGWFKRDKKEDATATEATATAEAATVEESGGLKAADIRKMAEDTLKLIQSKRGEFEQVAAALKQIPLPEQMGAKAREYQKQATALTSQINDLRKQAEGYIEQLEAMGVPVDSLVASLNQMLTADSAAEK